MPERPSLAHAFSIQWQSITIFILERQMFTRKLVRLADVLEITGLSRSQVYALIQRQEFIKPVKICRSSRWPLDAVLGWVDLRIAERDATSKSD